MAITIIAFMTNGGAPYSSYTPTISIWRVSDASLIVNDATMSNIASAHYKYNFTSFVYGIPYVYLITGDSTVPAAERYQSGSIMQEVADRVIVTVQTDGGNSATQFKTNRAEGTNDFWKDALCTFLTGPLAGQVKKITGYNGGTFIVTFTSGYTGTPTDGDICEFIII